MVTNLKTGKKYIGKKQYHQHLKVKVPGKTRRKSVTKPSNWEKYTTSSKDVNADIKELGMESFHFEIMYECDTKGCLRYAEIHEQHNYNVLTDKDEDGNRLWYNNAIGDVKFIPPEDRAYMQGELHWSARQGRLPFTNKNGSPVNREWTDEMREAKSNYLKDNHWNKGNTTPDETKQKISKALKGKPRPDLKGVRGPNYKLSKQVVTPLGIFDRIEDAAEAHNIKYSTARARAQRQNKGWSYTDVKDNNKKDDTYD
jgi:hypothetical protein